MKYRGAVGYALQINLLIRRLTFAGLTADIRWIWNTRYIIPYGVNPPDTRSEADRKKRKKKSRLRLSSIFFSSFSLLCAPGGKPITLFINPKLIWLHDAAPPRVVCPVSRWHRAFQFKARYNLSHGREHERGEMEVVSYNYQRVAISLVDIYPVVKTFERVVAYIRSMLRNNARLRASEVFWK